jgi:ABC-type dipeptide/oligopeptide/nickel transport system permease subunit
MRASFLSFSLPARRRPSSSFCPGGERCPGALVSVLALSGWVLYARTVRASVLTIRQLDYVEAARTLGASDLRVILLHILPNTLAPILVIGAAIFWILIQITARRA